MRESTVRTEARTRKEARLYRTIAISLDADELRETVNSILDKASAIEDSDTVRGMKVRRTNVKKQINIFEDTLVRLENRVEVNGGIFPLIEGIRSDFETAKKFYAAAVSFIEENEAVKAVKAEITTETEDVPEASSATERASKVADMRNAIVSKA